MVAKMPISVYDIMPGVRFTVLYEYAFVVQIMKPEYIRRMKEYVVSVLFRDVPVTLTSRRYQCEDAEASVRRT